MCVFNDVRLFLFARENILFVYRLQVYYRIHDVEFEYL